ncbi:hypothetical protein AAMO2058_000129300 [Amorphochlora amoebiformis]
MAGDKKLKKVKKTKKSVSSKDKSKKKRKSADSKLKSSEKSTKRQKVIPKTKADSVATPRRSPRIAGQAGGLVGDLTLGKAAESKAQIKNPNDEHGNPPVAKFRVSERSQKLLANRGITHLFPIQATTFDMIYEGSDVLGRARTGTGKTLAFTLPVVERLVASKQYGRAPRVVVLAPTRELAKQVGEDFLSLGKLETIIVYGQSAYGPQQSAMRRGVDVVVGTCGRVKDHLERGTLKFQDIQVIILDEADEMLNMGFADDVETILNFVPAEKKSNVQTLLFSATLPSWVNKVCQKYLKPDKKMVDLVGNSKQKASKDVEHLLIFCHWSERAQVMNDVITAYGGKDGKVIVFTDTKKDANELVTNEHIKYNCQPLHGGIAQSQRETTIAGFKKGNFRVLVATDVAARGLDISGVSLVMQAEPPTNYETYVHRSGRTGRANTKGVSVLFYTQKQRWYVDNIEKNASVKFKRVGPPNGEMLIKSSLSKLGEKLSEVSPDVVPFFREEAQRLISENNEDELCRTLAIALGHTQPIVKRSLMSSAAGFITVYIKGNTELRSLSYVWNIIRRCMFTDPDDKVRCIQMTKDKLGAIFEVPDKFEKDVLSAGANCPNNLSITIPTELPDVVQREETRVGGVGAVDAAEVGAVVEEVSVEMEVVDLEEEEGDLEEEAGEEVGEEGEEEEEDEEELVVAGLHSSHLIEQVYISQLYSPRLVFRPAPAASQRPACFSAMGVQASKANLDNVSNQDHKDEDLVSANSLDVPELKDLPEAKMFKAAGLPGFSAFVPDDVGKVLEGESIIDEKALQNTVSDISRLKDQAYHTMEFINSLHFNHHIMRQIHLSLRKETQRVNLRRRSKEQAIKGVLLKKTPLLSVGARVGIHTVSQLFVQNLNFISGINQAEGLLHLRSTLNTIFLILKALTPLSISDSKEFSPDVAVGMEPVLKLFRRLADVADGDYRGRFLQKGVESLSRFALARGTVSDVLSLIEVIHNNHHERILVLNTADNQTSKYDEKVGTINRPIEMRRAAEARRGSTRTSKAKEIPLDVLENTKNYPIGYFFRFFINFEPQDQTISLKGYERKIVTFKTTEEKYLSSRRGIVSLRGDCGKSERFTTEVFGDRIAFKAYDNRWLSAGDGQLLLTTQLTAAEKFRLMPASMGSKFPNHIGIQTNQKTFFTYQRGQGAVFLTKNFNDNCLFDVEASENMDLELDDDENSASDEKFPESADELMARYKNSGYLTIREGVDVKKHNSRGNPEHNQI